MAAGWNLDSWSEEPNSDVMVIRISLQHECSLRIVKFTSDCLHLPIGKSIRTENNSRRISSKWPIREGINLKDV
jgi:hypothetical protein